jgi:probable HAF family extracellular repeat protein
MKTPALILVSLMACSAIGTSTARAQAYIVRDLGVVEDMTASEATAVNSEGYVAGIAYNDTASCAFQYSKKLMQDAGGVNSRGFAINSAKLVVGDAYFTQNIKYTSHAVIFKGGEVRDLGVLEGQMYSRANGINAVGWVVGSSGPERDSTASRAFIWTQPTGMFDIGTLGGLYAQAYAINDWGYVTGTSTTPAMAGGTHAFLHQPYSQTEKYSEPMKDLGTLMGLMGSSYGMAINNSNHVVGYSTYRSYSDNVHAFLYNGKKMIDLGTLNPNPLYFDYSVALGLNNSDDVVGYSYVPATGVMPIRQAAFLWSRNPQTGGDMRNLNDLIGSAANHYWLFSASAINDKGQIAASGFDNNGNVRALLLTRTIP